MELLSRHWTGPAPDVFLQVELRMTKVRAKALMLAVFGAVDRANPFTTDLLCTRCGHVCSCAAWRLSPSCPCDRRHKVWISVFSCLQADRSVYAHMIKREVTA